MTQTVDVPRLLALLGIKAEERIPHDFWAPCPYPGHPESEPSWHIDGRGLNHCFGCGRGGGAADLAMDVIGLSTPGAAFRYLRDRGVIGHSADSLPSLVVKLLPREVGGPFVAPLPLGLVLGPMSEWPGLVSEYAKGRGLTPPQVARWGLGAGVGGRLLNRLWLPARRSNGDLASWTARSCDGKSPRYLDPRQGEGDRAAVFGEQHWPVDPSRARVVVTEGELNALACERAGAEYVAALGGSRLDSTQVSRVARFGAIVLALDPDRAGRALVEKLSPLARWREVRLAELPDGCDPCDVEAREGVSALTRALG